MTTQSHNRIETSYNAMLVVRDEDGMADGIDAGSWDTSTEAYQALIEDVERLCTTDDYGIWATYETVIERYTVDVVSGEEETIRTFQSTGSVDADEYRAAWGEGYAAAKADHTESATYAIGYVAGRFAAIDDTESEVAA